MRVAVFFIMIFFMSLNTYGEDLNSDFRISQCNLSVSQHVSDVEILDPKFMYEGRSYKPAFFNNGSYEYWIYANDRGTQKVGKVSCDKYNNVTRIVMRQDDYALAYQKFKEVGSNLSPVGRCLITHYGHCKDNVTRKQCNGIVDEFILNNSAMIKGAVEFDFSVGQGCS